MAIENSIYHGTLPLILSGPRKSRGALGTLDSAKYEVLVEAGDVEARLRELGFREFQEYAESGMHSMWLQDYSEEEESDLITKVSLNLVGLLKAGSKKKTSWGNNTRDIGLGDGTADFASPTGTHKYFNVKEPVLTVRERYFSETRPDQSLIGKAYAPEVPPDIPDFMWASFLDEKKRWNYPDAWVLDNRESEQLFGPSGGAGLWFVEDTIGYYHPAQPV